MSYQTKTLRKEATMAENNESGALVVLNEKSYSVVRKQNEKPEPNYFKNGQIIAAMEAAIDKLQEKLRESEMTSALKKEIERNLSAAKSSLAEFRADEIDASTLEIRLDPIEIFIVRLAGDATQEIDPEQIAQPQAIKVNRVEDTKLQEVVIEEVHNVPSMIYPSFWEQVQKKIIHTMQKPEHRQKIAAVLIFAIGFMIRVILSAQGGAHTGSGKGFSTAVFMWATVATVTVTGLVAGLVVLHKRQNYILKFIFMIPFGVLATPLFLLDNFFMKMMSLSALVFIGGFMLAGPVMMLPRIMSEKIRIPRKIGFGKVLIFLGVGVVLSLLYFGPQIVLDIPELSMNRKTIPIALGALLTFVGVVVWSVHKKNWFIGLASVPVAVTVGALLYGALYEFPWEKFLSHTPSVLVTAGAIVALVTVVFLRFTLKNLGESEKTAEAGAPASKTSQAVRWKNLQTPVIALLTAVAGFFVAELLVTGLPASIEKKLGEQTIILEPGKEWKDKFPAQDGYHVQLLVSEGEVLISRNGDKPERVAKETGAIRYKDGTRLVALKNSGTTEARVSYWITFRED